MTDDLEITITSAPAKITALHPFCQRWLSRTGCAWIGRPLDLPKKRRKNRRHDGWGKARNRGRGGLGEIGKSPWRGSWCGERGRSPWWSEPPPPASTAAAATPCGRRRPSRSCLGDFPCELAGRPTAATGGASMYGAGLASGGCDALFRLLCLWPRVLFCF
jgi:hypothetical protein